MSQADRVYWLHALTPVHVGSGRGEGYIDLPVAREKATNLPFVPGSAVKGVLADYYNASGTREDGSLKARAFGRVGDGSGNAGALVFTDTRLVCLPTRSFHGTFAWCTSRLVLHQFHRDLTLAGQTGTLVVPGVTPAPRPGEMVALIPDAPASVLLDSHRKIFLEDLDFSTVTDPIATAWAEFIASSLFDANSPWRELFKKRFVVLPDDAFEFLSETGTEVRAHVRIDDETGCVARGALWYEESLPTETVLAGLAWAEKFPGRPDVADLLEAYCQNVDCLQIGGKASVGKGRARCRFTGGSR